VRRAPEKQVHDRGALDALLDTALVAHVAVLQEGDERTPTRQYVIPVSFTRDHDQVLVHGSTASRTFRTLAAGRPTCLTVTLVDGIVVARSQFSSSMHYRCGMVFGSFEVLHGPDKAAALTVLVARLLPGLEGARPPSAQELAATAVLSLPLEEWSLKVSACHPEDAEEDLDRPVWSGSVPLRHSWGAPVPAPGLGPGLTVPTAIESWPQGRA
jgi:nitroimidazol reductase NimA-like FMN-containing flavoprotein (pyridoxamine 5'-phosphate oxidase superfamily)